MSRSKSLCKRKFLKSLKKDNPKKRFKKLKKSLKEEEEDMVAKVDGMEKDGIMESMDITGIMDSLNHSLKDSLIHLDLLEVILECKSMKDLNFGKEGLIGAEDIIKKMSPAKRNAKKNVKKNQKKAMRKEKDVNKGERNGANLKRDALK